ncbi:MAG: SH3 domain-containing protein, partial [Muribaculaceae bacterium]|nr:SH3 domain-containing protein [Muribaculaceae bacterium]
KENESGKDGVLTKGTEVRIVSEETDAEGNVTWYKVRLNSDYIGWVAADDLELL